jgi:putative serine protease PepD
LRFKTSIRSADVTGAQYVLVYAVVSGGPADRAGIQAGELIVSVDGKATPNSAVLSLVLADLRPDQRVPVDVRRTYGSQRSVEVQLGELPG